MSFIFRKEINIGELLTFCSILGSGLSLLWSWGADRDLRVRENSDKIRVEAAQTLGKINRAEEIYLSFYHEVQFDIVGASELMADSENKIATRDQMWKQLNFRKAEIKRRLLDEQLETAYVGLLAFDRQIDSVYTRCMVRLKALDNNEFSLLMQETEEIILNFSANSKQTALLGNELREVVQHYLADHEAHLKRATDEVRIHLLNLIDAPDEILYTNSK